MPRVLLLLAFMAGKVASTKLFWYVVFLALSGYLAIAPAAQRWDNKATTRGFIGLAVTLPIAWGLSRDVSMQLTSVKIKRHIGFQVSIDEMVHQFNEIRATNNAILAEIEGKAQDWLSNPIAGMGMPMIMPVPVAGELPASTDVPVEDLAQTLATATNSGTLIIAPSGCGKTSLLRNAIVAADDHYDSEVDFQVVDCKGEDYWCGLEKSPNDYTLLDDDRAKEGLQALQLIKGRLSAASPQFPTIAIIDEWNNGVASLQNSPEISREDKVRGVSAARQIVTKGRSKKVFGWLTTHTPKTDQIGMDASTRQSLNVIILGRLNKIGLIGAILKGGKFDFVDDENQREALLQQYQAYVRSPNFNPQVPIALTNLCGDWRLVKLPHYSDTPEPIEKSVLNSPAADLIEEESKPPANELLKLEQLFKQDAEHPIERFYHADIDESLVQFFGEDSKPKSSLSTPAQTILDKYTQKQMTGQYINASWVKNFAFRSKELSQISADDIRSFFYELEQSGYGAIAGEGSQLGWGMVG